MQYVLNKTIVLIYLLFSTIFFGKILNNLYFLSFDCKKLQNVILYLVNKIESFYYAQSLESNSKRHIFHFNPVNLGQGCMYFFSSIADKQGFNFMQRKKIKDRSCTIHLREYYFCSAVVGRKFLRRNLLKVENL